LGLHKTTGPSLHAKLCEDDIETISTHDYTKQQVHLSMPNYVKMTLKQFQHIAGKLQHAPYSSIPIQYGAKTKKHYATQDLGAKTNGSCSKYEASYYSLAKR
jgi:hypothetical protein